MSRRRVVMALVTMPLVALTVGAGCSDRDSIDAVSTTATSSTGTSSTGTSSTVSTTVGSPASTTAPSTSALSTTVAPSSSASVAPTVSPSTTVRRGATSTTPRPTWLGTRALPLRPDGYGVALPTPAELRDRRFAAVDVLPVPTTDRFEGTVAEIPADVLARSTWNSGCPVGVDGLRYLTLTFWGFDGLHHRGEMIVNASIADAVVEAFRKIDAVRFPIEEMRVTRADELDAAPTGDGNNTGSFVCRATTGSTGWSNHAYGKAIDINPFLNPYAKGDLVVPELASDYLDRANLRPGMIVAGDAVTTAFTDAGWGWGGNFTSLTDTMHFSVNGH